MDQWCVSIGFVYFLPDVCNYVGVSVGYGKYISVVSAL